jgi:hypothetical protein
MRDHVGAAEAGAGVGDQGALRKGVADEELGIRFWRMSNGVRVSYKNTQFEAGQVMIKIISRGGKMVEVGSGRRGAGAVDGATAEAGGADGDAKTAKKRGKRGQDGGGGARGRKQSTVEEGASEGQAAGSVQDQGVPQDADGGRAGQTGELALALDTLMDSGLGDLCAQDVERYLTLHAVGVDSSVSMESVSISLSISTANEGLERVLQVAHAMLSSGRFDSEAFERAKKERQIEYQQRRKSLNGLTWEALMRSATGGDDRFLQMEPAHLDAITLEQAAPALQAALRPEHLEVVVVGDVTHSDEALADLLLLYFGTLSGGVPSDHPSAVHWRKATARTAPHACRRLPILEVSSRESDGGRRAAGDVEVQAGKARGVKRGAVGGKAKAAAKAASEDGDSGASAAAEGAGEWSLLACPRRTMRVKLLDEEPRAVIYILARTCGFYGQTAEGGNLSGDMSDGRRLHLARSFHVLSKVLNNRLHDDLREKMGLGYSASFGSVQYSMLDGGFAYVCVTAFPDKIDKTVTAALSILEGASTRPVTQSELIKARDPITASEKAVLAANSTWLSYCTDLQVLSRVQLCLLVLVGMPANRLQAGAPATWQRLAGKLTCFGHEQSTSVPKDIGDVRAVFKHYASLTCDDVNTAARLCLRPRSVHISIGTTSGGGS